MPVKLIAHRGASGYAPENTLASIAGCLEMGANAIEFDVQQTRDNRLVVLHDLNLTRVAGVRKAVRALTYAELARLDVGKWYGPSFAGQRVPLLEELLDMVDARAGNQVELQLEIKNGRRPYDGIERRALEVLASRPRWKGRVVLSSFDHGVLKRARALSKDARLGYLVGGVEPRGSAIKAAKALRCESVHLSLRRADRAWIDAAREAGLKVLVYTVNSPDECRRLESLGVDGVFTNFPDLMTKDN